MKMLRLFSALLVGLLAGCTLLPPHEQRDAPDIALANRMAFANKEMQVRLQYADWLLASRPQQRRQERQRLRGADDLESRVSLAMVDSHPDETVASRRVGLARLEQLLPELGLDSQAFLRSWIALSEPLLMRDSHRDTQQQEIQKLRSQIQQLTSIDDQLNQRKLNEHSEAMP